MPKDYETADTNGGNEGKDGENGNDTEPVTAGRRHHHLMTIRSQPGWKDFPDCLPSAMRTTKGGKMTDFGNNKLRIIERIALNAQFPNALAYFTELPRGGTRLLRLKDLELSADHFDTTTSSYQSQDDASSCGGTVDVIKGEESPPRVSNKRRHLSVDGSDADSQIRREMRPSSSMPYVIEEQLAYHPAKRQRTGSSSTHANPPAIPSIVVNELDETSLKPQNLTLSDLSGTAQPSGALSSLGDGPLAKRSLRTPFPDPDATSLSMSRAIDELITRAKDQKLVICLAVENQKEIESRLADPTKALASFETDLVAARKTQASRLEDLEQAKSVLDALKMRHGEPDTSLSRAILATVGSEYEKAQEAVQAAAHDVEIAESQLTQAQLEQQSLPVQKNKADDNVAELKAQTQSWLIRLAEVGAELTSQLNRMD
ncbi:hypothetical protein BDV97DRAFT_394182 [Delphinella strobiligena]|nr:hypothetical protein BDV97DRAFT_394182 [Delphinella strobiligena]